MSAEFQVEPAQESYFALSSRITGLSRKRRRSSSASSEVGGKKRFHAANNSENESMASRHSSDIDMESIKIDSPSSERKSASTPLDFGSDMDQATSMIPFTLDRMPSEPRSHRISTSMAAQRPSPLSTPMINPSSHQKSHLSEMLMQDDEEVLASSSSRESSPRIPFRATTPVTKVAFRHHQHSPGLDRPSTPPGGKQMLRFTLGYREDCELCRLKTPGHYSHVVHRRPSNNA